MNFVQQSYPPVSLWRIDLVSFSFPFSQNTLLMPECPVVGLLQIWKIVLIFPLARSRIHSCTYLIFCLHVLCLVCVLCCQLRPCKLLLWVHVASFLLYFSFLIRCLIFFDDGLAHYVAPRKLHRLVRPESNGRKPRFIICLDLPVSLEGGDQCMTCCTRSGHFILCSFVRCYQPFQVYLNYFKCIAERFGQNLPQSFSPAVFPETWLVLECLLSVSVFENAFH